MTRLASPYLAPGFYGDAIAKGRHRDIVGGRWGETARVQMAALIAEGMASDDHLLDVGCGALRLGHLAVPFLQSGHYWGTDASLDLMRHGRAVELADPDRLPLSRLVADTDFAFPGIPETITLAIAWGVFTHLPAPVLAPALATLRARFPDLRVALVTLFLSDEPRPTRQPDGVVTHPDRPPYHRPQAAVEAEARAAGFTPGWAGLRLPRGQALLRLTQGKPDPTSH